jgi:alpha-amylase/alpha-mannosidase (GH57 family)
MSVLSHNSYVCIHGHWYQPPRENPFTGEVGVQPSAAPFANWNERITAECYAPNTRAEILGDDGAVRSRINNYEWVSSDWGPTLLDWLEEHEPETYGRVIAADAASIEHFNGHGTAVAHTFNHTILPLSNRRDKRTQIVWGIADFRHRFGRDPAGMWLPETAVDLESLELMAEAGIRYTILSPYQAAATLEEGAWTDVVGGGVDTRVPYTVQLFGGRTIGVFFYNGPLSQEIAFNGILEDGSILAKRLVQALGEPGAEAHLSHVATDGETYGHHHRHGEMALAKAIQDLRGDRGVELTNYSAFLAKHPPTRIARIIEGTSWSCAHGVERWRGNCGCHTGQHPDWNQEWRAPLRESLDYLRNDLIEVFESRGATVLQDPWAARDEYIEVILGEPTDEFLDQHGRSNLSDEQRNLAIDLLEIQHRAMLMYTSCGWFFDDISGLEAVFVLRQAGRVIDLARRAVDRDLEPGFVAILDKARSNVDDRTGRDVFEESVVPFMRIPSDHSIDLDG